MKKAVFRGLRSPYRWVVSTIHATFSESGSPIQIPDADVDSILEYLSNGELSGPVFQASDVADYGQVGFVADPFFHFGDEGRIHLFFEVFNQNRKPTAVIGHAESTDRGCSWTYSGIILECDRHASYPYVFEADSEIYLIPGLANRRNSPAPVKLFRATSFPYEWELEEVLIEPDHLCYDPTIFQNNDTWWAMIGAGQNDELHLYSSDSLTDGSWLAHPENPVVTDRPSAGRPGGRPINIKDRLYIPFQDCESGYGDALRMYEIEAISKREYSDSPAFPQPMLSGKGIFGWNSGRMHHLDFQLGTQGAFCAMDGDVGAGRNFISGAMWSIGFAHPKE